MERPEIVKPSEVFRLWDSAKELIELSRWIPEVVGTKEELVRIGTVKVIRLETPTATITQTTVEVEAEPVPVTQEQLFIEADVSTYVKLRDAFRAKFRIGGKR